MSNNVNVLVVGAGAMAREYVKVLKAQNHIPCVIGRGETNAKKMEEEMAVEVLRGGLAKNLNTLNTLPNYAVVAVGVEELAEATVLLLRKGIKNILVEKPGGIKPGEIEMVSNIAKEMEAKVYVAYNRRYYASTEKALDIIREDGGVTSFNFEFTEWGHVVRETKHSTAVKEEWMLANSTHVIDLAFFLGGFPREITCYKSGSLDWHKKAAVYAGSGISEKGALFSYQANWAAPGRWSVEILTCKHRLYFKPMEKLQIQEIGSVAINPVEIEDKQDLNYKPGIYKQIDAFINNIDDGKKISIEDQLKHLAIYKQMEE